jgi:PadR family transcriptional regulator, regulatory protein PadR
VSSLNQLRKGTTHLLVLSTLTHSWKYGYQIMRDLEAESDGYFSMTASLLYPTLHKLEDEGLITGKWVPQKAGRDRKYYTITTAGRKVLSQDTAEWERFYKELSRMVSPNPGAA